MVTGPQDCIKYRVSECYLGLARLWAQTGGLAETYMLQFPRLALNLQLTILYCDSPDLCFHQSVQGQLALSKLATYKENLLAPMKNAEYDHYSSCL